MSEAFVKNYHTGPVTMWVNGDLQGYIPSGKTAWIEWAGFVTRDSGVQPDGSIKTTHAYGGWEKRDASEVIFAGRDPNGVVVFGKLSIPKENKKAQISFAGSPPPKDLELERAGHVQQGNPNIALNEIRVAANRDFAQSPAGRFASPDGKISLDIRPSSGGGFEGSLTSFGKTYPLKLTQRGGRVRLSNNENNLELDAQWSGDQLELTQGTSKKYLKDLGASVEKICELADAPGTEFAGSTWKITLSGGTRVSILQFQSGGSLRYSFTDIPDKYYYGKWEKKETTVVFGEYSDPHNYLNKYEGTVKGGLMSGTHHYFNHHNGHAPDESYRSAFKGERQQ